MAKIFYDHLIKIEEIVSELDKYEITVEEKEEFISIIDETVHHRTLDIILSNLQPKHHAGFLSRFYQAPFQSELLDFLKEQIGNDIEEKIEKEAEKIKKEILSEIKKSKRK